jgi:ADP-heptose:LPS heptosyltransferase
VPPRDFDLAHAAHILVVKPDEIGDFILATPFLRGLRRSAPVAEITLAVSPLVSGLAAANPNADRLVTMELDRKAGKLALGAAARADWLAFAEDAQQRRFDLAVVPRLDFDRYAAAHFARDSGAKRVAGFSENSTPLKAARNAGFDRKFYTDVLKRDPAAHEVEHNLALLAFIGGRTDGDALDLPLPARDRESAARRAEAAKTELGFDRILAVAPGSSYPAKELPARLLAPVAAAAAEELNAGIVILGNAAQRGMGEELKAMLAGRASNLCGDLTLPEAAALIGLSAGAISMCSAAGHIAAALDIPAVVFSCHPKTGDPAHFHSPLRFRPWAKPGRALVIQPETALAPCAASCEAAAPHCIGNIDPAATIAAVARFFAAG